MNICLVLGIDGDYVKIPIVRASKSTSLNEIYVPMTTSSEGTNSHSLLLDLITGLNHVFKKNTIFLPLSCRSEFVFINPNSKGQCGCGESFMTKPSTGASSKGNG